MDDKHAALNHSTGGFILMIILNMKGSEKLDDGNSLYFDVSKL